MRRLMAAAIAWSALAGGRPGRAADAVLVPAVGVTYTTVSATAMPGPVMQFVTTEAKVERSDGVQAKILRVFTSLPPGSPLVNGDDNYSIYRYFALEELGLEFRANGGPPSTQITRNDCDPEALAGFLPLGHIEQVTVACKRTITRDGKAQAPVDYTMTVSYEGKSVLSGPLGDFPTHHIRMRWKVSGTETDGVIAFDDTRGLILSADFSVIGPSYTSSTHTAVTSVSP